VHTHREKVSQLDGIGRAMPWTMGAFAVGSLGLIGIPPVNGFFSKWFLCTGSIQAGWPVALAIFLLSGLLNAAYFLPILHRAFFRASNQISGTGEASWWMVGPLCATAALALVHGLFPNAGFHLFELAVSVRSQVLGSTTETTMSGGTS
jgi:multicomponent Na+:H+ antiporter subunit D